jgi:hypothetical protein
MTGTALLGLPQIRAESPGIIRKLAELWNLDAENIRPGSQLTR